MNANIINRIKEIAQDYISMGVSPDKAFDLATEAVKLEAAPAQAPAKGKKPTGTKAPELVEFKKLDGTVKMVSAKQAAAWDAARKRSEGRKSLDEVKAEWDAKHKAYKPSKELIAALKANPVMTRKEAAKLGFIGTKDELKALKHKHNVYAK